MQERVNGYFFGINILRVDKVQQGPKEIRFYFSLSFYAIC